MNKSKKTPKEIRGAILGTLLGDSYITSGNMYGCEQINKELIKKKAELLSHYSDKEIKVYERIRGEVRIEGRLVNSNKTYSIRVRHPRFKKWHSILYRTGSRQVTYNILKFLNAEGLALWVMDDGYMDYKKASHTRNLRICTDSFDELSHKEIIRFFKKEWDIDAKIFWHQRSKLVKKRPRISFNAKNTQKLISIIYPYFIDSMLYKIDMHYKEDTIKSVRCSDEYREASKYITQRKAQMLSGEDIV